MPVYMPVRQDRPRQCPDIRLWPVAQLANIKPRLMAMKRTPRMPKHRAYGQEEEKVELARITHQSIPENAREPLPGKFPSIPGHLYSPCPSEQASLPSFQNLLVFPQSLFQSAPACLPSGAPSIYLKNPLSILGPSPLCSAGDRP